MKILFTGDINFRGKCKLTLEESQTILSETLPYMEKCDFVIPNLECPLANTTEDMAIKKSGPNLVSSPETVSFLKAMNTYGTTLANNHIGDFGEQAIIDTFFLLSENGIKYCGAGKDIDEAYNAMKIEKGGKRVSLISVCENEFGLADEENYGSAAYDSRRLMKKIISEKKECDFVIVVFHGGNEFDPLPSPDTCERYRLICDMGADAVIGGHTHCPQGYEVYDGKPIIYSMGNFLFKASQPKDETDPWFYGYMAILDISEKIDFEIVPYKFDADASKISVFEKEERANILDYVRHLSEIIQNKKELDNYFKGWAWNHKWCPILPHPAEDLTNFPASDTYNLVKCEAHLSQLKRLLKIYHENDIEAAKEWEKNTFPSKHIRLEAK